MSQQPIGARLTTSRDEEAAHRDRDLRRLLAVWQQLNVRCVAAQAHGGVEGEIELVDTLAAVEDALRSRHRREWAALQPSLQWLLLEAEHTDLSTSARDCLTCRRLVIHGLPMSVAGVAEATQR